MPKKTLLLRAGFAATLALCATSLLAQNTSTPPANPPSPKAPAPKVDTSKLPPPSDKKGLTFAKDIAPMLKASCANCHSGDKPKGGYNVTALASTIQPKKGKPVVIAGHSDKSVMVWYVAGLVPRKEMPPLQARDNNPPLTTEQISLLRGWIDEGAK